MADKDPKGMTASELLRWAANGEPNEYGNVFADFKLLSALSGKPYAKINYAEDVQGIRNFADKIDAEIEMARMDARNVSFWTGLDARIALLDYPLRKNETLDEWLERCFIPRPLDEAGEPVQFGDSDIEWDETGECRNPGAHWNATAVDIGGKLLATGFSEIIAVAKTDERGRVKRRAPEVLGADGLPIKGGETVWLLSGTGPHVVDTVYTDIQTPDGRDCPWADIDNDGTWAYVESLTHTPPDTQERIDEDARKSTFEYWGCGDAGCEYCPAKIEGKIPRDRLDTRNCEKAMLLDLLRRQRELDARKGGAE